MQATWGIFRRLATVRRSLSVLAGPTIVLSIILSWSALLTLGWALIYWPRLPEKFSFSPGLSPANQDSFVDALYLSLMSLTTVGYGDITPSTDWLRIASTVEALVASVCSRRPCPGLSRSTRSLPVVRRSPGKSPLSTSLSETSVASSIG